MMKHFIFILVAVFIARSDAAALKNDENAQVFDERQNGTENYRINIDGVFVLIAPADDFIKAAQGVDLEQLIGLDEGFLSQNLNPAKPAKPGVAVLSANGGSPSTKQVKPGTNDANPASDRFRQVGWHLQTGETVEIKTKVDVVIK